MKTSAEILNATVLDLCDETYYDPQGFKAYDLKETPDGPRSAIIVCLNALVKDNEHVYDLLTCDYKLFTVGDFGPSIKLQSLFDMSYILKRPVSGFVSEYDQKSFIIATCQDLWAEWLSIIFLQGGTENNLELLSPRIIQETQRLMQKSRLLTDD